jgi:hypothetical protein
MTSKFLFVGYGGGHISMLLPVMRALREQMSSVNCMLLAMTTGHARAVAAGEQPMGYKDLLHLVNASEALEWGMRLSEGNRSPDVSLQETVAYMGINYLDLIAQHGLLGAEQIYREQGRYGFLPLNFMRRLLDELAPDVVVATNSPRSERAALEAAIAQGIPNVGMVDLFGQDGDNYVTRAIKPGLSCVIAESVRQRLIAHGFAPESVVVTGSPAFDGLFTPANQAKARAFLEGLNWSGLSPILWAGHIEPTASQDFAIHREYGFPLEVEARLRQFVSLRGDLALIVRYHPSQWHGFPRLPAQDRVHFSVPSVLPIHPLILAAKVVVVQNSTVGLESAVGSRPVVSLEYAPSVQESFSLAAMGVSTPCHDLSELTAILDRVLAERSVPAGQYQSDGRAAVRVADLIAGILKA